jgi:hypothetical protein
MRTMNHNFDCQPETEMSLTRLLISFVLITFARFAELINQVEVFTDFALKIFQIGAYGATMGMFVFTLYKFIKDKK